MNNKEMLDKFKMRVAISNFEKECESNTNEKGIYTLEKRGFWRDYIMKKRIIATTCVGMILMSGVVFAANIDNIKNYFRGLGKGIDTAIENGYVENPEMDYIESNTTLSKETGTIVEDVKVDAKIEDFLMGDLNLSTQFSFKFDEKIHSYINLDNIDDITLNDLFVRDEENHLIYSGAEKDTFEKYCKEHNLNYVFGEYDNEKYFNNGLNWFPSFINKDSRLAKLTYNMYSEGFPKSKKLYFSFSKITITEHNDSNEITIQGNWEIELDVPEKMYNRTSETYRVVSCSNDDFNVYSSSVSDTGFEIGIIISNIEKVEYPEELEQIRRNVWSKYEGQVNQNEANKEYLSIISQSPYRDMYMEYFNKRQPINCSGVLAEEIVDEGIKMKEGSASYVENSNGEKFECTMSPSRRAKNKWLEGNKFDFYETFGMTKYDATDNIKVVLNYYGEPVIIELEKLK